MEHEFDWNCKVEKAIWLIQEILAKGSLTFLISQAGTGKSWFIKAIINSLLWGLPLLDRFEVAKACNVMLIDQDSPSTSLKNDIILFGNHRKEERKGDLFLLSHQGLLLGRSMARKVKQIEDEAQTEIPVIMVDTLTSVCGAKIAMVNQLDMGALGEFQSALPGKTLVFSHHISEKMNLSVEDVMTGNAHQLAMYSSVINQKADMMFYLANPYHGKNCDTVYTRTYSKRFVSHAGSFVWALKQIPDKDNPEEEWLEYLREYEHENTDGMGISKQEELILGYIKVGIRTAKGIEQGLTGTMSIDSIRAVLHSLEDKEIIESRRERIEGKKRAWQYAYSEVIWGGAEFEELKETKETEETEETKETKETKENT